VQLARLLDIGEERIQLRDGAGPKVAEERIMSILEPVGHCCLVEGRIFVTQVGPGARLDGIDDLGADVTGA
jgi:hypothetical protein